MIQGGGFEPGMKQKAPAPPSRTKPTTACRTKSAPWPWPAPWKPHSASAQFFINVKDNDFLDHSAPTVQGWGYTVFAEVVEGMDVVEKIKGVATGSKSGHQDVPQEDVIIERAEIVE